MSASDPANMARKIVHRKGLSGADVPITEEWRSAAAAKLRELEQRDGLTQKQLAKTLGCSTATVSRTLFPKDGKLQPTSRIALALSEMLGCFPPVASIRSQTEYDLAQVADRLRLVDAATLDALLESAQLLLGGVEGKRNLAKLVSVVVPTEPKQPSAIESSNGGENGGARQAARRTVGRPRRRTP